jgi:hypothetical protein
MYMIVLFSSWYTLSLLSVVQEFGLLNAHLALDSHIGISKQYLRF